MDPKGCHVESYPFFLSPWSSGASATLQDLEGVRVVRVARVARCTAYVTVPNVFWEIWELGLGALCRAIGWINSLYDPYNRGWETQPKSVGVYIPMK